MSLQELPENCDSPNDICPRYWDVFSDCEGCEYNMEKDNETDN